MKKKLSFIILLVIVVLLTILLIKLIVRENTVINTKGISIKYRVYTTDGWSDWYQNGQVVGKENKSILAIEAKIESKKKGNILYNVFSTSSDFNDNDTYNGKTAGDKKVPIYGIKLFLTDELYKDYHIYYRTHNKDDGWLDWTNDYNVSGDNGKEIDQIQIKILEIKDEFEINIEKASIGF